MTEVTIATVQFTSGNDIDANFARMGELIHKAADAGANLVVFQEFCNHPCYYDSPDHVWQGAIQEDGHFVKALGARARERGVYVSFNATVRREWPVVEDQNFLLSPEGEVVLTSQKQILMNSEKDFFAPGSQKATIVDTEFGRIGLMSCMEGLIPETPRVLAVLGADLILNSLSSNGIDEAHTHIPVRAAENGVYVVSSNRSGPLVDAADIDGLAEKTGFPTSKLFGGGESQIVGPDGVEIVRAKPFEDDMVLATVNLGVGRPAHLLSDRRPEAYGLIGEDTTANDDHLQGRADAQRITVAAAGLEAGPAGEAALQAALDWSRATEADLLVLPELFAWDPAALRAGEAVDRAFTDRVLEELGGVARETGRHIVAGVPGGSGDGATNDAVLVGPDGVVATYSQVHVHREDRDWATAGSGFVVADLPFGRVGLMVGYDVDFPESARVLALQGADVIACPVTWRQPWESRLAAPERSAENRVTVVVSARADSPVADPSTILAVPGEYRFPQTGEVNMPDRTDAASAGAGVTAEVDLNDSRDKRLMKRTDLVADRKPHLYDALTAVV